MMDGVRPNPRSSGHPKRLHQSRPDVWDGYKQGNDRVIVADRVGDDQWVGSIDRTKGGALERRHDDGDGETVMRREQRPPARCCDDAP